MNNFEFSNVFNFSKSSGSENVEMVSTRRGRKSTEFKFGTTKLKLDANNVGYSSPISEYDHLISEFSKCDLI